MNMIRKDRIGQSRMPVCGGLGIAAFTTLLSGSPINDSFTKNLLLRQLDNKTHRASSRYSTDHSEYLDQLEKDSNAKTVPIAQDILEEMRTDGLPISAIAEIVGVERKSIYSWLKGSPIKHTNEERILELHSLLSSKKTASYKNLYRYWRREVEGVSISSLLKKETLEKDTILDLLELLWPLAERSEKQFISSAGTSSKQNPILDGLGEAYISDET